MWTIRDFCSAIDSNPPDFIGQLISSDKCRTSVNVKQELNEQELANYEALREEHKKAYTYSWKMIIERDLNYRKTHFVNDEMLTLNESTPHL